MAESSLKLVPNGRIWIDTEAGAFLGYGRIELLEKIKDTGSLRKAALEMKMSYQQAWKLLEQMNERSPQPLVLLHRGGKGGGNAILTPIGEKAIELFKEFNIKFQEFLKTQSFFL
jgi:molybdate transport system regulatory protein